MMKLKSFGCSFIFGDDLQDTFLKKDPWSSFTWPALLAQHQEQRYVCYAQSGSGNLQILDSLLKQVADPDDAVYVIGWTWIDRLDYTDSVSTTWRTILPTSSTEQSEFYYKNLHSQYRDKLATLTYISTAIRSLQAHGRKFVMTCQDPLIFETEWHANAAIYELQNAVNPYITKFNGLSFLEWSRCQGFKISNAWHPLEDAHQAAFEYIRDQRLV